MQSSLESRARMASIGKRAMQDPLKAFYQEVMGSALSSSPNAKLAMPQRQLRETKPTHKTMELVSKGPKLHQNMPTLITPQKIIQQAIQNTTRAYRGTTQQLNRLKHNKDQLTRMAERLDARRIQSRVVEERNSREVKTDRYKIPQRLDTRKTETRAVEQKATRGTRQENRRLPLVTPVAVTHKDKYQSVEAHRVATGHQQPGTQNMLSRSLNGPQRASYQSLVFAQKMQNLSNEKTRKMSMQQPRGLSICSMKLYSQRLPEKLMQPRRKVQNPLEMGIFQDPDMSNNGSYIKQLDDSRFGSQSRRQGSIMSVDDSLTDGVSRRAVKPSSPLSPMKVTERAFRVKQLERPPGSIKGLRESRKSNRKNTLQEVVFLQPVTTRKEQVRAKLRKSMFAVYWLCCQIKDMKRKVCQRRNRHAALFNAVIQNVITYLGRESLKILSPVVQKIKGFKNLVAVQQNSKPYLIQLMEIQKAVISLFPALKDLMFFDKHTKNILKLFMQQREFIPDAYLTRYQLARIEMSRMFGYPVKTFCTSVILIITFFFVRVVILEVLSNPVKFGPQLITNPMWNKIMNDLTTCFYVSCVEVIDEQVEDGQFFVRKGNWENARKQVLYRAAEPLSHGQVQVDPKKLVSNEWPAQTVNTFRNKFPNNWELIKDSIRQFCYQIQDELGVAMAAKPKADSRASKRSRK